MRNISIITLTVLMAASVIAACSKSSDNPGTDTVPNGSTFDIIQDRILTSNCAIPGCHSSITDATFSQHSLVLAKGSAFDNLVGKKAKNAAAAAISMLLVKASDPDNSFLYHKITCMPGHHSGNFGSRMPMGGKVLTKGQVELVRQWIMKGAPRTGNIVDLSVLNDTSACLEDVVPLPPPAAGEGFQLKIPEFTIARQFEREIFMRQNTPNTTPVFVNRLVMRGGANSHHFLVYNFRNQQILPPAGTIRDLRNADGSVNLTTLSQMQNHIFFGGSMEPDKDVKLPDGVALKLEPNTPLDLNAHYFNVTDLTLKGVNYVNFYTVPQSQVQHLAGTLDLGNQDITIPAGQTRTFTKNFTFSSLTRVIQLTSHTHKLGVKYVIRIFGGTRNGEIIYENTDWSHPLIKTFQTPVVLQPGQGLTSEVTYTNTTNRTVGFGLTSEDEMNIIFGYYY